MFDPASINAALASAKVILDLLRNTNDPQLAIAISREVGQLQSQLLSVQQQALSLQNENQELRGEIRQIKQAIEDENSFQFTHGVCWKTSDILSLDEDEEGNRITAWYWDGLFCPLCKNVNGKAVRLKNVGPSLRLEHNFIWKCEVHNTEYEAPTMQS